jgi:hypothetical protein
MTLIWKPCLPSVVCVISLIWFRRSARVNGKLESSQTSLATAIPAAPALIAETQDSALATTKPHCFPGFYLEIADEPPKRNKELDLEEQLEKLELNSAPEEEAAESTWTDEKYVTSSEPLAE